jgi:hypothetical protein
MTVAPLYAAYDGVHDTGMTATVQLPFPMNQPGVESVSSTVEFHRAQQGGIDRVFVGHSVFVAAGDIYGCGNLTYHEAGSTTDLDLRWSILCQAALAAPRILWRTRGLPSAELGDEGTAPHAGSTGWAFGNGIAFVCNDWPTAPAVLRLAGKRHEPLREVTSSAGLPVGAGATAHRGEASPGLGGRGAASCVAPLELGFAAASKAWNGQDSRMLESERLCSEAGAACGVASSSSRQSVHMGTIDSKAPRQRRSVEHRVAFCIHNLAYQGIFPKVLILLRVR